MHTFILFLTGVALAINSLATPLTERGTFSSVTTRFDKYCTNLLPYDQNGASLKLMASCSTSGVHNLGAKLSESTIDINECLANDDGVISARAHGGALRSCHCDFGTHVCGTGAGCATTTAQCSCKNKAGADHVNKFDIAEYIGVGYDSNNHFVLYCSGIYGAWDQCLVEGAAATC